MEDIEYRIDDDVDNNKEVSEKLIPIKVMVNENEYESIIKLVNNGSVSVKMKELYLEGNKFSYNKMPKLDKSLLSKIHKIQNGISRVARSINEADDLIDNNDGITSFKLLNEIDKSLDELKLVYTRKDLTEDEIVEREIEESKKWLKRKSFIDSERRTREIRINFKESEYELAKRKSDREDKKLATSIREFFLGQNIFVINAVPVPSMRLIKYLDGIANELFYVAEKIESNKEEGFINLKEINKKHLIEVLKVLISITIKGDKNVS